MAYTDGIKKFAIAISKRGVSAEEIVEMFSKLLNNAEKNASSIFLRMGQELSIPLTLVDWFFLAKNIPDTKTVRRWISDSKRDLCLDSLIRSNGENVKSTPITNITVENTNSSKCMASPENIDVSMMKKWKVPASEAAGILYKWRCSHKEGNHDMCRLYRNLIADILLRKIPFKKAEAMLEIDMRASLFGSDVIHQDVELARIYRPWESRENWENLFKELDKLHKPGPEKERHLKEISNLLMKFSSEIRRVKSGQYLDYSLKTERDNLFSYLIDHCFDVAKEFSNFKFLRREYDIKIKHLVSRIMQIELPEASKDFYNSIVRYAINKVSPNYRFSLYSETIWQLMLSSSDEEIIIAEGSRDNLEKCRMLHFKLVSDCRRDSDMKEIISKRKKILRQLKDMDKEIMNTLSNRLYEHQFCAICLKMDQ